MVILATIRQSPAYLYIKTYCICALVTLFQASPVSSRLPRVGETLQLSKFRIVHTRLGPRIVPIETHELPQTSETGAPAKPAAPKSLVVSPELVAPWAKQSRLRSILQRWYHRAVDLSQVKTLLRRDDADVRAYPEINWDATVRRSSALCTEERRFIELRKHRISSQGADSLHRFLQLPPGHRVDPRDVPLIALGGSGGGYRAMYGFAAHISASKKLGLWDCIAWTAGVSGSCWTLAAYYTIAYHSVSRLTQHYVAMARELAHPMSVNALNTVARSSRGVYFLIGPLVRKARNGIIGLGIMDLYATLTTTYQLISRQPRARLSRATFQWSKIWSRSGMDRGAEPMPILTAVRRAPRDSAGVKPHTDSSISKGEPPSRALSQHQTHLSDVMTKHRSTTATRGPSKPDYPSLFQWFEITPLEIGSPEVHGYIPTWSWGRTFAAGRSVGRAPEQSLALILGQCTAAPAGPLTGYISALLASMPKGTMMSRLLLLINDFASMKRWERLWGNPIRAGHDPNPFYGLNTQPRQGSSSKKQLLGIGIGSLNPSRLDQLAAQRGDGEQVSRDFLDQLARRILCDSELRDLEECLAGVKSAGEARIVVREFLSVIWAAKIAAHKALRPHYSLSWLDLAVTSSLEDGTRVPHVTLTKDWASMQGQGHIPSLRLNVSHENGVVTANVIAERESTHTPGQGSSIGLAQDLFDTDLIEADLRELYKHDKLSPWPVAPSLPKEPTSTLPWEPQGRVRLMDSGMSNNLPNHILARPERGADVLLAFDASSDVQLGSALKRIQNFADDCHIELEDQTTLFQSPQPRFQDESSPAHAVEARFLDHYVKVFHGVRENGDELYLIYCPLLPNGSNPDFNPSTASFSTSYNLIWTPCQIRAIFATSEANLSLYAIDTIRDVVKKVYFGKRERRLELSQMSN
ncbi:acyl transferase/acyl hydrolase/lysophospholipase [Stachybotrys elegans]|uniref:Lysophospholipase n=1 Tax=Stachybotrys elegans TaxID=80388 RepID=A0A8K0WQ14_9HYPO|nr:acyl transferase/acyl hydrolase/lysophospholipase [Stachybotrys elegans]